mmetsp:Transcript_3088/g.11205  ORF Transcript_3088/g.11205 Transcript_3088/m.11205 type:complete len:345 (+) Transcript_3088:2136-3170(+)
MREAAALGVDVPRAADALRKLPRKPVAPLDKVAHAIAKLAVPLRPAPAVVRKGAHLVQAARVPRLGDELHPRERRMLADGAHDERVGERVPGVDRVGERVPALRLGREPLPHRPVERLLVPVAPVARRAREDRGEVEAEAVDVVLLDPVHEAVDDELRHDGVVAVERVATPAVVVKLAVPCHHVPHAVVQPAERQRQPLLVPFRRVVEHHVEDHLDPRLVARLDHLFELALHRAPAVAHRVRGVASHRRVVRHRAVPPKVDAVLPRHRVGRVVLELVELVDREELDGVEPHLLEVLHALRDARKRPRVPHPAALVLRKPAHVHLVDDEVPHRVPRRLVILPVEI